MNEELERIQQIVYEYLQKHPEHGGLITDAITQGIKTAFKEERKCRANMEAALVAAVAKKWKAGDPLLFVKEKIKECKGMWLMNWDWFLNENKKEE